MTLVKELKKKKKNLKTLLEAAEMAQLPWGRQFKKWQSKSGGSKGGWILDREGFPNYRELTDREYWWVNRYETIDVKDQFEDFVYTINEYGLIDMDFEEMIKYVEGLIDKVMDGEEVSEREQEIADWGEENSGVTLIKAAKEVMEGNVAEYKFDW